MNNFEFVERLVDIATNQKTTYAAGGYGQTGTTANKLLFKSLYPRNREGIIKEGIDKADADTHFYDCNCLVKSTINGNKGYTKSPCPDVTINKMLADCADVSTNFDELEIGEYLVYGDYSHCGVYAGVFDGKRMAVECTSRWANGVQLIDIDSADRKGFWKWHGKLTKYITYPATKAAHAEDLEKAVNELIVARKGMRGEYVAKIQRCLNDYGYMLAEDGIFGSGTEKAVKDFQQKNFLIADGIVGFNTISVLIQ